MESSTLEGHDDTSWSQAWLDDPGRMMAALVGVHRRAIYGCARELCGTDRSADVAQEVFLKIWCNPLHYLPSRGPLRAYLLMVTRSVAIDLIRSDSRQRNRDERSGREMATTTPDHSDDLDPLTLQRLAAALGSLDPRRRELVVASFVDRIVHRELSNRFGLPEGTVKSRIRSGLLDLRARLRELGASELG